MTRSCNSRSAGAGAPAPASGPPAPLEGVAGAGPPGFSEWGKQMTIIIPDPNATTFPARWFGLVLLPPLPGAARPTGRAALLVLVLFSAAVVGVTALMAWKGGHGGERLRRAWPVCLAATAALTLANVAEVAALHRRAAIDGAVRAWMLAHRTDGALRAALAVTRAGSAPVAVVVAVALAAGLWRGRRRVAAASLAFTASLAAAVLLGMKALVHRQRPPGARLLHETAFSFPSGHTTVSTAVALVAGYVLVRERLVPRGAGAVVAIAFALAVGVSRLYLDVHWATDILGAWSTATLVVAVVVATYERAVARHDAPDESGREGT